MNESNLKRNCQNQNTPDKKIRLDSPEGKYTN